MNYELAKKLKNAGFPYTEKTYQVVYPPGVIQKPGSYIGAGMSEVIDQGQVRIPTLSELIEACGLEFKLLEYDPIQIDLDLRWMALPNPTSTHGEYGSTPEEAVANLYLALNKK